MAACAATRCVGPASSASTPLMACPSSSVLQAPDPRQRLSAQTVTPHGNQPINTEMHWCMNTRRRRLKASQLRGLKISKGTASY